MAKRYLIVCQNPALAASIELWLVQLEYAEDYQVAVKTVGKAPNPIEVARTFDDLADWIESEMETDKGSHGFPELIALTDLGGYGTISGADLNPLLNNSWSSVLAMLIFGFPEVHWVFLSGYAVDARVTKVIELMHFGSTPEKLRVILDELQHRLPPLFDGNGLRSLVRQTIVGNADLKEDEIGPPRRSELAVAIDEERSFSWLHAYTAYRFGFRAHAVSTFGGMKWALTTSNPRAMLIFEDYFLQFGDEHRDGFSHLRARDTMDNNRFGQLADADYRIFVTCGHHHGQDVKARMDNPVYLSELRGRGKWNCHLTKPVGGIFNLWNDSGLNNKLRNAGRRGLAAGFFWPPKPRKNKGSELGHSTPGRLLTVADRLIARAGRQLQDVQSVPDAVRGAVLSLDALELLGGKTPTTSLDAVALKHHFEVLAECQFVGVQQHMDVDGRMNDIRLEVDSLSQWFGAKRRQKQTAAWNAELSILNELVDVFREFNQFDEERECMNRIRHLHNTLWLWPTSFRKTIFRFPLGPVLRYLELLLSSFAVFSVVILAWVIGLGLLFYWAAENRSPDIAKALGAALSDAWTSFFSPGTPINILQSTNALYIVVSCIAIVSGFFHLGVFISHLYSIVNRK